MRTSSAGAGLTATSPGAGSVGATTSGIGVEVAVSVGTSGREGSGNGLLSRTGPESSNAGGMDCVPGPAEDASVGTVLEISPVVEGAGFPWGL